MYRQSPNRSQRSKRIKLKHVLQICLLLAVCFWLIYQVKHSHDKKKEYDESDARGLLQSGNGDEFIKLGRKDPHPRVDGNTSEKVKHDELVEEEETAGEDVDENKNEEDEPEDKKVEEKEDEAMGDGDDETDEHEQGKSDAEVDREEDLVEDDEKEDGVENEARDTDSEDAHGQVERESSVEDTDHDGDEANTHEAREEHYRADDASSAVTHDTQAAATENENEHVENSNENPENALEEENKENNREENNEGENRKDLEVEGEEMARDDRQPNVTTSKTKVDMVDNPENGSPPNNTVTPGFNNNFISNSSSEVTTENHDLPSQNVTESEPELGHSQGNNTEGTSPEGFDFQTIGKEQANSSVVSADSSQVGFNTTVSDKTQDAELRSQEFLDSSTNDTKFSASENINVSEASLEVQNKTEASTEKTDGIDVGKSDVIDGTDETLESTMIKNPEDIQQDAIDISDTSNSFEEKDVRTDLDTLPQIQTEGINNEDVAAE